MGHGQYSKKPGDNRSIKPGEGTKAAPISPQKKQDDLKEQQRFKNVLIDEYATEEEKIKLSQGYEKYQKNFDFGVESVNIIHNC
jgi:hypothetical protein